MASKSKRVLVGMVSKESKHRVYYTFKNPINTTEKLTMKKYDPVLQKHVIFEETKKNLGRNEVPKRK